MCPQSWNVYIEQPIIIILCIWRFAKLKAFKNFKISALQIILKVFRSFVCIHVFCTPSTWYGPILVKQGFDGCEQVSLYMVYHIWCTIYDVPYMVIWYTMNHAYLPSLMQLQSSQKNYRNSNEIIFIYIYFNLMVCWRIGNLMDW